MLGAIIGDLAASTYEHDKEWFYHCLISPYAIPSDYGNYYLQQLNCIFNSKGQVQAMPILRDHEYGTHDPLWNCSMIMLAGVEAWLGDINEDDGCNAYGLPLDDKPDWYAYRILRLAVYRLRQGDTKRRIERADFPLAMLADYHYQDESIYRSLSILCRCWPFFKNAFDFTSAIHNAARGSSDKDRHINCMFTGLLAEAMYGSEAIMLKKKYEDLGGKLDPWSEWAYHVYYKTLPFEFHDLIFAIQEYQRKNRVFFPKNSACTNVERHNWFPVHEHMYSGVHFSQEARRRMLKSFYTSWDNRFGLYWDDGWFYMYRSSFLLGRFRLSENSDGTYSIAHLQETKDNENLDIDTVLREVIDPTLRGWEMFGDEDAKTTLLHMFKFFDPKVGNPGGMHFGNHWWLWEKMVWEHFEEGSLTKISDWGWPTPDFWQKEFSGFCSEECRMLDFFLNMHAKWIPYYDAVEALKEEYIKYYSQKTPLTSN